MAAAAGADVLIVGGALAGGLLALELRRRGASVIVLDAQPEGLADAATAWSYGVIPGWPLAPTPLARAAAGASRHWRTLQRRHGDLGWRPVRARLLAAAAAPALLARLGALPLAQVDATVLLKRWPRLLADAGVQRLQAEVLRLEPHPQRRGSQVPGGGCGWCAVLADGSRRLADQVVLAAGAACRDLWPSLPQTLQRSWAGVLQLSRDPSVALPPRPELLLPGRFSRIALERRSGALRQPAWVVDAGWVPRGGDALLGQLSWIAADDEAPAAAAGPDPGVAQGWLRAALAAADPALSATLSRGAGVYRQIPVAFCRDGRPLAAAVAGAPGLWLFSGFSGGFAQVPVLAPLLAAAITGERAAAGPATRQLQRLEVWPVASTSGVAG